MSSYQTNCLNISKVWSDKREINIRDRTIRFYHGWMTLPFTIIAIPLTLLFITANIRAIKAHRVSRKFHVLLVNRAIGDLSAIICSLISIIYVLAVEHINPSWLTLLNTLFTACFWSGLVTYTSIGLLKLYGIAEPLKYKKKVTMERCVSLIKISWLVFILIFGATMGFTILVKIEILAELTGCKVENCLTYMYKVRNVLTLLLYFTTILTFIISVFLIKKAKERAKTLNADNTSRQQRSVRKRFKFPMIKLTLGVTTFTIFHFPYAIWNVALTFADGCYFVLHYNKMQSLLGIIRSIVLLRIIVDSFLGFFMDKEIRHQLFTLLHLHRLGITTSELFSPTTTVKLSTTTNSIIISSESTPDSFDTVTNLDEKLKSLKEKRTVSARISSEKVLNSQHRRCSDKSEYANTKNVKF
uniref:G-protein coupled receptors family 1 profile domain-containing protein n=1 Tax=Meloidogyne incognita TaxID=6306 RepID=A0A914KGS6_MELIC